MKIKYQEYEIHIRVKEFSSEASIESVKDINKQLADRITLININANNDLDVILVVSTKANQEERAITIAFDLLKQYLKTALNSFDRVVWTHHSK